jgi:hypothetical protein
MNEISEKIRRICLYAGPGAGKSVTSTNICSKLSFKGYNIECVEEVIKDWTYIPRSPESSDSLFLQASQIQKEDLRLRAGVDFIVTDSPITLQYFYAWYHKDPFRAGMYLNAMEMNKRYPALNIFVERNNEFYNNNGRYETLEEAKKIDSLIKQILRTTKTDFVSFSCTEQDNIIDYIIGEIGKDAKNEDRE